MEDYTCYFDGACAPTNPGGHLGMGFLIYKNNKDVAYAGSKYREASKFNTNNIAEYGALWYILNWLDKEGCHEKDITIYGDSQLVINQMKGAWRIQSGAYVKGAWACKDIAKKFKKIKFMWIPRDMNTAADSLSNKCLESRGIKPFSK